MPTIQVPVQGQLRHFRVNNTGVEDDPLVPVHDVYIQDQVTPLIMLPMVQQLGLAALSTTAVVGSYIAIVDSAEGISAGNHFRIINALADRYYFGTILGIDGTEITLDTSLDFAYLAGSEVTYSNTDMAVDGSSTPVEFHLRTGEPSIPSSVDIVKLIMVCECKTAVDLNKFGDQGALTRGIVFKITNGVTHNILNAKTNKDLTNISTNFEPYVASNPAHAVDGFTWELSFKDLGVAVRVDQYGQLALIVQDNLTDLTSLICMLLGHVVE